MKKLIVLLAAVFALTVFTACADDAADKEAVQTEEAAAGTAEREATVDETEPFVRDRDAVYEYVSQEIWCENDGNRIYGVAYIPVSENETRFPLVIHAHGMGSNHEAGEGYCKRYAEKGFAAYTFDFPGGSRLTTENKSDGDMMEMSAVTEAADLQAILDSALTWDFVDPDNVFLEGGSMGGLVATMVGLDNSDAVKGMILHYPALYLPQGVTSYYSSPDDVPDSVWFGEDYMLSGKFVTDVWDVDVVSRLGDYPGSVTIIQGSEDELVSAVQIENASKLFRNAEFHLIEGAGHGFGGEYFETAVGYGLDFLFDNT